ncbi:ABC transporter ATP-binding protein [Clostridium felsineum]|uniref:ABC transporter ATP-binding protein n=1 Tax=Clostridium felsineum TaxID=36839 RepID=UPI00098CB551|nr:ABC transporter ATP-binding protein [Clostridium felsineum]URZ14656.1 SkfA peptide export ATP-binding protein SkfE [Clostridium felsineum DSM 794]
MEYILQCKDLTKHYGKKIALNKLNINIPKGKIVGLLGPNGAGKSTLIKIIESLLSYDSGEIKIDGKSPSVATKKIVAYLPDKEFLYENMKIKETVNFFHKSFDDFRVDKAYEIIKSMNLNIGDKISSLSKGMQERLTIALTFARKAKLFVLDEPLAAVDPSTREKIINIILDNFDKESSILISTHLINDVEKLFDEVIFVNDGRALLHDNVEKLKKQHNKSIEDLFKEVI